MEKLFNRESIINLYFDDLQAELIDNIEMVILFNLENTYLNLEQFKKQIDDPYDDPLVFEKYIQTGDHLIKLVKTLKVFNYQDLGLTRKDLDETKLLDEKLYGVWSNPLKELLKNKEVLLIGEWLSQYTIQLSEQLEKVFVYKKNFFSSSKSDLEGFYNTERLNGNI